MTSNSFFEPDLLRALIAVAETVSFSRAAEQLRLSQSTLSGQVRRLEAVVQQSLFNRTTHSVQLTPAGETMVDYARMMLRLAEQARLQVTQPPLEGRVRFGLLTAFAAAGLPAVLRRLHEHHPRLELSIETGMNFELLRKVDNGSLDLVLAARLVGRQTGEPVARTKIVWVGLESLTGEPSQPLHLALYPAPSLLREVCLRALHEAGRSYQIVFESASPASLRAAVLVGMGVSAFPLGLAPRDVPILGRHLGLPALPDVELVIERRADPVPPVIDSLADFIRTLVPVILREPQDGPPTDSK